MIRLSWQYRALALVWAVLQFALPSVVTLADVVASARNSTESVAHVEDSSSSSCQPSHSAECGLCRYLSGSIANDRTVVPPIWPIADVAAPSDACPVLHGASSRSLPPSRAPPVV